MKYLISNQLSILMIFLIMGCSTQIALSGKAREDYIYLIKPYGTYWIKDGVTIKQRRKDSWSCGAARTNLAADHVIFDQDRLQQERLPEEEDDFASRVRLTKIWIACMQANGYRYESWH